MDTTTKAYKKWAKTHCLAPDRDVPKLTCGYPLPCPHHNRRKIVKIGLLVDERSGFDRRIEASLTASANSERENESVSS